jgi:hypothetical protein
MKRSFLLIVGLLFIDCAGSRVWLTSRINATEAEAKANNQKLANLKIGQSKSEVVSLMGPATRTEAYQLEKERVIEFLFYRTAGWSVRDPVDKDYQFTPITFENDKLVGWGRNYYETAIKHIVDITIKKDK